MLKPLSASKWDATAVGHFLNRAGFGGPPAEIEGLVSLGMERAISLLVDFEKIPDPTPDPSWARPDPDRAKRILALRNAAPEQRQMLQKEEQQLQRERILELRGWWLQRMAGGPRPLQEKL